MIRANFRCPRITFGTALGHGLNLYWEINDQEKQEQIQARCASER